MLEFLDSSTVMPSKAALFNTQCEVLFDFGIAHRNTALYNLHGNGNHDNM